MEEPPSGDEDEYAGSEEGGEAPTEAANDDGQRGACGWAVLGVGGGHEEEDDGDGYGAFDGEVDGVVDGHVGCAGAYEQAKQVAAEDVAGMGGGAVGCDEYDEGG